MRLIALLSLLALCLTACRATAQPAQNHRAAEIRRQVTEVLTGPDFHLRSEESITQKLGRRLAEYWDRFVEWFSRLFRITPMRGSSAVLSYVFLGVLLVGLAFVIAIAVRRYVDGKPEPRKKAKLAAAEALEPEESVDSDEWLAAAKKLAASGDFRRAYRAVFVALLLRLDQHGAIKYDRSRTNGDYVRALRGRPPLLAIVRPLSNEFDAHWYGRVPATEDDYCSSLTAYEQALSLAAAENSGKA